MSEGTRRIFYDKATGEKIHEVGRNIGVTTPTIEQDIATWTALSERNRDTFDVIELLFGEKQQDFAESNGYRVNVETKELEFSYPDASVPEAPQVFEKALTDQIKELKSQLTSAQDAIDFLIMGGM